MAIKCPVGFDTEQLRDEVSQFYSRIATDPEGECHFHRGPEYAADYLGYDIVELKLLPDIATKSFCGAGNPHKISVIPAGAIVVDIGCGSGMDLLLAGRRVGATGRAIGVDMTDAMRERSKEAAKEAGLSDVVEVRSGDAEALPVEDGSVDVVISNGALCLTTDKGKAFSEIVRVLKPGGRMQLADIVVEADFSEKDRNNIDLWTG